MHTFMRWILTEGAEEDGGGGEGGRISVVLPDVIKTEAYTNNFMGICCLQSSVPSGLKLQRELHARLVFRPKRSPGEAAILLPKP